MQKTLLIHGKSAHPYFQEILDLVNQICGKNAHCPLSVEIIDNTTTLGQSGFNDKLRRYLDQYERIIVDLSYSDRTITDQRNPRLNLLLCLRNEAKKRGQKDKVMASLKTVFDEAHQEIVREALETAYEVPLFMYTEVKAMEGLIVGNKEAAVA